MQPEGRRITLMVENSWRTYDENDNLRQRDESGGIKKRSPNSPFSYPPKRFRASFSRRFRERNQPVSRKEDQ